MSAAPWLRSQPENIKEMKRTHGFLVGNELLQRALRAGKDASE
jgi:hypothetical protein